MSATEKLETFEDYLKSNKRRQSYIDNPNYPNQELLEERLAKVHKEDVDYWELIKPKVDLSKMSDAEFEAEMQRRNLAKVEQQEKLKKDYESLKTGVVIELCKGATEIHETLKSFKLKAFSDMQTVYEMLKEYSNRHKDGKGNFQLEHGNFRVSYKRQGKASFDERSHQAEKHIIDFVNSKFENDVDTKDLVMSLLERKKGELDINLVQKLYAMENRFQDENWKRGIELLKESYSYSHSKDYIGFETKNDKGEWQTINLQFSNI